MPNGEFATVFSFEECFPHHCDFMWLIASGSPMRLNRNMMFKDLIHGFEPRAVLPDNVTVHRIAELADALQTAQRRVSRAAIIRQFVNLPCIGIQLDVWTDSNGVALLTLVLTTLGQWRQRRASLSTVPSSTSLSFGGAEEEDAAGFRLDLLPLKSPHPLILMVTRSEPT